MIVAAGALGTNNLLANCRHSGALPRISDRLGDLVRTNSESIQSVTAPDDERDFSRSVAITSSIYPDPDTHIEVVTYGQGGDAMAGTFTAMTGPGTKLSRPIKWLAAILRHPLRTVRMLIPHRWSQRTVILLVMQTVDAAMHFRPKRKLLRARRAPADRTGPRPAQPDLHPSRRAGRPLVRQAHRRRRPERGHRVDPQHPLDRPHPRRRRRRCRRARAAWSTPATASSATRTCS